jgi:hypothetical protein
MLTLKRQRTDWLNPTYSAHLFYEYLNDFMVSCSWCLFTIVENMV